MTTSLEINGEPIEAGDLWFIGHGKAPGNGTDWFDAVYLAALDPDQDALNLVQIPMVAAAAIVGQYHREAVALQSVKAEKIEAGGRSLVWHHAQWIRNNTAPLPRKIIAGDLYQAMVHSVKEPRHQLDPSMRPPSDMGNVSVNTVLDLNVMAEWLGG